jgi:Tat protein secretion system quality control protein TatD with DNase activity
MRFMSQAQMIVNAAFNILSNTAVIKIHCIPVGTDMYNPTIIHWFQNSVRMKQYLIKLGIYIYLLVY